MTFKEFTQSKDFSKIIYIIGGLLVALVVFQAGIFVGYRVAAFSINWDNAHNADVRSPQSIFAPFGRDMDDVNSHGAIGEIISVQLPVIMVKGPSGNEAIVLISSATSIRNMRNLASTSDLKVGSQIVTIGTPDEQGRIDATFIRLVPAPQSSFGSSSTPSNTPPSPSLNNK
jgi:hypothetical protein